MTPEEADRKIEFILETTAQNTAGIAALRQSIAAEHQAIAELRQTVAGQQRSIDGLREAVTAQQKSIDGLREAVAAQQHSIERLRETAAEQQRSIADLREMIGITNIILRDSMKLEDARISRLDEKMLQLMEAQRAANEAQKITEERLNALIDTVERHIGGPDHGHRVQ